MLHDIQYGNQIIQFECFDAVCGIICATWWSYCNLHDSIACLRFLVIILPVWSSRKYLIKWAVKLK